MPIRTMFPRFYATFEAGPTKIQNQVSLYMAGRTLNELIHTCLTHFIRNVSEKYISQIQLRGLFFVPI